MNKLLLILSFLVIVAIGCSGVTFSEISTCDDLKSHIIKMSEENKGPFSPRILKSYEADEVESTEYVLECKATAKWSSGGDIPFTFYLVEDDDGDQFIGYEANE